MACNRGCTCRRAQLIESHRGDLAHCCLPFLLSASLAPAGHTPTGRCSTWNTPPADSVIVQQIPSDRDDGEWCILVIGKQSWVCQREPLTGWQVVESHSTGIAVRHA